ncbi:putative iron-dependent peroxidase [Neokomagataea thailandica NBRC 106555]|uniref:Iron-dependent peroxidase n=1 Tax=Neokomagataea thailandica NBRC 106555 TaxID=1223520 RepID=A0ABQ0QR10_9PROT|nr:putative iron-dependent peroxidase [Neokomagataea thailandica NBRC 106555]
MSAFIAGRALAGSVQALPVMHQPGIETPQQPFVYFITFDVVTEEKSALIALMKRWTNAADALMAGRAAPGLVDSEETEGLNQNDITLTFGFGPTLFSKDGKDRFGLAARRPAPLADLPRFTGDQLVAARTGGDLCVQCCADDPQTALHLARIVSRLAYGVADARWAQSGFLPSFGKGKTARNLMGFKDGTINPDIHNEKIKEQFVWAAPDDEQWMQGGSYLVARLIRVAVEHWDRMNVPFQEQTMGRQKASGAPIGGRKEFEPLSLKQMDHDGNPITAQNAHSRLAAPEENGGAQILRRAYSYENGLSVIAERWPPWRQANEFDTGLLFLAYQRDPRTGFTKIFERMAKFDMMNQFTTHIGGGLFACPGRRKGQYIGEELLS